MAKRPEKNLVVGIDIGTSKVVVLIGEIGADHLVHVVGLGVHPSNGLKRGVVVNIESTVQSIQQAVEAAEAMAGYQIHSAYTGISGSHINSLNSHGIVAIRDHEVKQSDVDRVIDAARAVAIPADRKVLHILPQEFIIDQQEGILEPIGMSGVRLESKVHMVTGALSAAQNIVKCVRRCGLEVSDVILEQLASSYAVLMPDEKELGVCMVDMGGGTTDMAVFTQGAIRHTAVIPIAGDQVTSDLAIALRTPTQAAEAIKLQHACVVDTLPGIDDSIEVKGVGDRPGRNVSRRVLWEVVNPRYEELFALVRAELRRSGFEDLVAAGIVLTGGAAKIQGSVELAEKCFEMPVRLGAPQMVVGPDDVQSNPIYATGVGLLLYGHHQQMSGGAEAFTTGGVRALLNRMKQWFRGHF